MRARNTVFALSLPVVAAMFAWLALAGTGAFAETKPNRAATCSPNGTALSITAYDHKYDKDCMAVPANQAFTIDFDNEDRIPHNVSIYEDETASKAFFKGEIIDGPKKITYHVQALPEGRFFFRCDPHLESMYGTFIVGNPPPPATTTTTAPPPTTTTTSPLPLPLPKL